MRCPNLFKASGLTHPSEQIDRLKSWQAKRSEDVDGYDNWDLIASGRYHAGITRIFGNYHFVLFFPKDLRPAKTAGDSCAASRQNA